MSEKDLNYFMALPYPVELEPIPMEEGGGFAASIPLIGRYAVHADGETVQEALENLEKIKKEQFTAYLSEGVTIPEPQPPEENYSGKFVLRIPKYLHRKLASLARENGVSLNHFITSLIPIGLQSLVHRALPEGLNLEQQRKQHSAHNVK